MPHQAGSKHGRTLFARSQEWYGTVYLHVNSIPNHHTGKRQHPRLYYYITLYKHLNKAEDAALEAKGFTVVVVSTEEQFMQQLFHHHLAWIISSDALDWNTIGVKQ